MYSRPTSDSRVEFHVSTKTLFKIVATIGITYAGIVLWELVMLLFLSLMIAVTLHPLVSRLERRKLPRWVGILLVACSMIGATLFTILVLLPSIFDQAAGVGEKLGELREAVIAAVPSEGGLRRMAERVLSRGPEDPSVVMKPLMSVSGLALAGIWALLVVMVFSVYFLVDGLRAWQWFLAFFNDQNRNKLMQTADEASEVFFAYVAGQLITSILCSVFVYVILLYFEVPAALVLAVLAGIFDVLPILGFFLSAIPAVLMALTVSPSTGFWIFLVYTIYHGIESYLIIPRVYGNRLRVSNLAVLLALMAGGLLAGIPGALAVLPIIASYPSIERIWLSRYLGRKVVSEHKKIADSGGPQPALS